MKYRWAALAALALDIDGCRVEIRKDDGILKITVSVPAGGNGDWVVERAIAEYIGLAREGSFECPGLTAVAERSDAAGRILVFHIPEVSLRIAKK